MKRRYEVFFELLTALCRSFGVWIEISLARPYDKTMHTGYIVRPSGHCSEDMKPEFFKGKVPE